jgi:hypothetical protein
MPTGLAADEVNFGAAVAVRVASAELDVVGPVPGDEAVGFRRVDSELALRAGGIEPPDQLSNASRAALQPDGADDHQRYGLPYQYHPATHQQLGLVPRWTRLACASDGNFPKTLTGKGGQVSAG